MDNKVNDKIEDGEVITPADSGGATIILKKFGSRLVTPSFRPKNWYGMRNATGREDDLLVIASAKSGMHFMYEIVRMLKQGSSDPITNIMEIHHLDFLSVDKMADISSPRTLTSHRYPDELPQEMIAKNCKIVHVIRNPKDACVSYYHHLCQAKNLCYEGKFNDFIELFVTGQVPFNGWEDHLLTWQKFRFDHPNYPIYQVRYENLITNPTEEIKKLAIFLQVPHTDKLCEEIAVNTSFDKMKKQKESLNNPFLPFFKDGKDIMYRQGKSRDWKNYFTTEEAEKFEKYYSEKLDERFHIYLQD